MEGWMNMLGCTLYQEMSICLAHNKAQNTSPGPDHLSTAVISVPGLLSRFVRSNESQDKSFADLLSIVE
jgi:hypothetical protein